MFYNLCETKDVVSYTLYEESPYWVGSLAVYNKLWEGYNLLTVSNDGEYFVNFVSQYEWEMIQNREKSVFSFSTINPDTFINRYKEFGYY